MAQTIQIKRSSSTATPTSLSAGELAYSDSSDKLFIGQPSNNTVVPIGGKYYTDILDGLGAGTGLSFSSNTFSANVDGTNSEAPQNSTTTTGRTYKVQVDSSDNLVVNVPWSGGNLATTLAIGNDTSGNDIDVSAGDDINFSTTSKAIFGGNSSTANRMEIGYTASGSAFISETGSGTLAIRGQNLSLTADDSDDGINVQLIGGTTNLVTKIISDGSDVVKVSPSGFELGALGTTVDIIRDEDNMASDDADALATQQSIKAYVDNETANFVTTSGVTSVGATAPVTVTNGSSASPTVGVSTAAVTNGGTALATGDQIYDHVTSRIGSFVTTSGVTSISTNTADQLTVTDGSTATPELDIVTDAVADNGTALATGDQIHAFVTGFNYLTSETFDSSDAGNFVFNGSTLELSGGSTMTIGASNGSEAISIPGSLTISGNLNVTGDVNSTSQNNLDVTDKLITVGVGQSSGAASAGSGIKVDGADARLLWSSTQFEIDDGDGNLHGIIHEGNSATQTYTIDGGTF